MSLRDGKTQEKPVDDFGDGIVEEIVTLEDDSSLEIFTWRFYFVGTFLAIFGGCLAQIYIFKPNPVQVSPLFLLIIAFSMGHACTSFGRALSRLHSGDSKISRFLYPGPFNVKEHVAITLVCSTASGSALATELIAALDLFYNKPLSPALSIMLVISSQCLGFGFAGILRKVLVYPKVTVFPTTLSTVSLYSTLHKTSGIVAQQRMKLFWALFIIAFIWCWFPQYIAPTFTGVSVFCLFNQKATPFTRLFGPESYNPNGYGMFTNIFGGSTNGEGLGLFSLSFDWNLISNIPLTYPWVTQVNMMIGVCGCVIILPLLYVYNVWNAQSFPFLAQSLFLSNGSSYDQLQILNSEFVLDEVAYSEYGEPYFATSWAYAMFCFNLSITAAITHIILYNWSSLSDAYSSIFKSNFKPAPNEYQKLMEKYAEVPQSWYLTLLLTSAACGIYITTVTNSGLSSISFCLALLLATIFVFVVGFLLATCGYSLEVINIVQMCGGLSNPGNPVANMYFTLFGNNSVKQATAMLMDLKIGQYMKIPPRAVFFCQIYGAVIGSICNYLMTTSIIANNREILLDPHGTYRWSGYMVQNFNSLSITWGALPFKLYAPGQKYFLIALGLLIGLFLPFPFWILHKRFPNTGFNYINWGVLGSCFAYLTMGVNSHMFSMFIIGFVSQYWIRRNRPAWFKNYNYIVSAGLDAGTQVAVLVINMTVLGALNTIAFPKYALNPVGNPDYCPKQTGDF